ALAVPVREVEEEGGEPLLGAHGAEHQHHLALASDLAREEVAQASLEHPALAGEGRHTLERHDAEFAVLERRDRAIVPPGVDAFGAEDVARDVIARDLLLARTRYGYRLAGTRANGEQRGKRCTGEYERVTLLHPYPL